MAVPGVGGGGATTSVTFANTAAGASPATTPLTVTQAFKRRAVPTGFIAVPTVSGSPLTYQADSRTYWDDGSLRVAVFRCLVGAVAGGGAVQITFPISAGSYANTSTNTTADITGSSDFKVVFSKVHTACIADGTTSQAVVGITVNAAGGTITGGTVKFPATLTTGTINVQGGGGTGGQISIASGTVSVVSAGSGYTAPGTFTSSFNSIVASGAAKSIFQYAKGPVCDAWRGRQQLSGMPHFHVTHYVERWKDGGGSFLAFKAYAVYGSGMLDTVNPLPNYTFDIDWKNGATVIRGTTNSDPGFTNIVCYAFANAATFKRGTVGVNYVDTARPDWCNGANAVWASDAVVSSLIQQRTATECDELKATGMISPWLAITPTNGTPAVGTATPYVTGSGNQDLSLAVYQPFASAGLRCPFGVGGDDITEAPIVGEQALHWMWLRQGNTANANVWLTISRCGAAHGLGTPNTGAGWFDPTGFIVPSVVPSSAQTFSGMSQSSSIFYTDLTWTGYLHPMMISGGNVFSTFHQPNYTLYAYLHDGEQWMLDALLHSAAAPPYWQNPTFGRQVTLGATTYYGLMADNSSGDVIAMNVREPAWWLRSCGYAAALLPTTWADGTALIEQSYAAYIAGNLPTFENALISFSGTYSTPGGGSVSKTIDYTASGIYPEMFKAGAEIAVPFMDDYELGVYAHLGYLLQGTTAGTQINNFLTYRKNYYTKLYAYVGSHYLNTPYRINVLSGIANNSAASDTTWSSEGVPGSPGLAVPPQDAQFASIFRTMSLTNGSATATLDGAMIFQNPSTRITSGSRIKLTTTNIQGLTPSGVAIPTPFSSATWYYWKELTSLTGQLCTDAGLTLPVTCTQAGTTSGLYFWVVPANTLPADNSGAGTYGSGTGTGGGTYLAFKYGTMRALYAFEKALNGSVAANTSSAVSNLATMFNSLNVSPTGDAAFAGYMSNAYDDQAAIG